MVNNWLRWLVELTNSLIHQMYLWSIHHVMRAGDTVEKKTDQTSSLKKRASPSAHWTSRLPHWSPRVNPLSWMEYINLFYFYSYFLFNITPLQNYTEISWTKRIFFFCKSTTLPFLEEQHWHVPSYTFITSCRLANFDVNKKFSRRCVYSPTPLPHKTEYILVIVHGWALTLGKYSSALFFSGDLQLTFSETQISHWLSLSY